MINIKNLMISNKVGKNFIEVEKIDLKGSNLSSLDPIGKAVDQIIQYSKDSIVMVASNNIVRIKEKINEYSTSNKDLEKKIFFAKKNWSSKEQ